MNQTIRVLSPSLELLGEIDDYESLQFIRRFQKPGEFELHINLNKNLTEVLQEDNFIYLSPRKVGVIRYKEISRNDDEELVIKGYTLQGILSRRITYPPEGQAYDSIKAPLETVMKHYVISNAISPEDSTRIIQNLVVGNDLGRGPTVSWDSRFKQLDEELTALSSDTIGWDMYIDLDSQSFIFEVIAGRNLTTNQTTLPPVIFSIDFDNIKNQTFVDSATGYKNTAYVGGQGEGVNRAIAEVGNNLTGLERIEVFIDARDVEADTDLPSRGTYKLEEYQRIQTFESEILTYGPFIYGQDWDIGDTITATDKKLGLTLDTPITEVKEIYEPDGFVLEGTFGKIIPTLIDKIKQTNNVPMTEKSIIPSKTSDLENDTGYVTQTDVNTMVQDKSYTHNQISPANIWTITHNLNKYPAITITDSSGNVVVGDTNYESVDKVTLSFTAAFAGKAFLN